MRGLSDRYAAAVSLIDAANAADPNVVAVRGREAPLALVHGQLAAEWIAALVAEPDEPLLLAARAHHLRRWEVPRASYPEGRPGYLRWRRDQKARHARDVEELLRAAGYGDGEVERVQALVRRDHLASDPGAQAVEDAACLVFIETQLASIAPRFDHEHLLDVIRKTARKMSAAGVAATTTIELDDSARALLAEALGAPPS